MGSARWRAAAAPNPGPAGSSTSPQRYFARLTLSSLCGPGAREGRLTRPAAGRRRPGEHVWGQGQRRVNGQAQRRTTHDVEGEMGADVDPGQADGGDGGQGEHAGGWAEARKTGSA